MAKTNYTKVEEALAEGMRKIEVDRLLKVADEKKKPKKPPASPSTPSPSKIEEIHLKRLIFVQKELKALQMQGKDPYKELKIDANEMEKFLNAPNALTSAEWEKVKEYKEKIINYTKQQSGEETQTESNVNQDFVEQQRKKQQTKRFNINDKWIPLR